MKTAGKIKGFILGVFFTAGIIILLGASYSSDGQVGRYRLGSDGTQLFIVDTATGVIKCVHCYNQVKIRADAQLNIPFSKMETLE